MGKKQHQKDKMYITATEWREQYGGKRKKTESTYKRLPFYCCALSLQNFTHPYCTKDGHVFDLSAIVPFIRKYGINPITGEKMDSKGLFKLNFHKNADDKYHCPVMYRVFTDTSAIVAIKTTGNVYSLEAVTELNLKSKNMMDLISSEPFNKSDIITIQDPQKLEKQDMSSFYHIKEKIKMVDEEEEEAKKSATYTLNSTSAEAKATLAELATSYVAPSSLKATDTGKEEGEELPKYFHNTTTGDVSRGFTSTAAPRATKSEMQERNLDEVIYEKVKKKSYVRLVTSLGDLNLELHTDMVPKPCHNFMLLCKKGYYNNTVFHRSIRNFMVQGGDPTGTGKGGESAFGSTFPDHFKPNLTHSGRGVLSMANRGPNTNTSQFFFTYRSCNHLDNKHTVFGRLVGGLKVLDEMEAIATDNKDKPTTEIKLISAHLFVDSIEDTKEELINAEKDKKKAAKEAEKSKELEGITLETQTKVVSDGVGKYIGKKKLKHLDNLEPQGAKRTKVLKSSVTGFRDFSAW